MGDRESRIAGEADKSIENIYSMFQQSNSVVMHALISRNPSLTRSRIKNIESVIEQLLSPFKENDKYIWGGQIYTKFAKHFSPNFQMLWTASREQFHQLLLQNCKVTSSELEDQYKIHKSFQNCFYRIAGQQLERGMQESFTGDIQSNLIQNIHTLTIIGEELKPESGIQGGLNSLDLPFKIQEVNLNKKKEQQVRRFRIESSSLVMPQTLFANRLSLQTLDQFADLLKFYKQFAISLQQIFFSNNLVSCPIKNFIFCFEERISKKKIKMEKNKQKMSDIGLNSNQNRNVLKKREANNNLILYEIKNFLNAYTEFVWMFFQLHQLDQFNLSKIINSEVLYGIVFKNLWPFVDWILDRGYEFQQAQLQNLMKTEAIEYLVVPPNLIQTYTSLIDQLRDERHPQQYLKKVVIFYRQVSKKCSNADELLAIFEEVIFRAVKQKGSRNLALFRMRNIIEKLLNIQDSSLSGGEIAYSWTNWCVLIQILRKKASFKYGDMLIFKKSEQKVLVESQLASEGTNTNSKQEKILEQKYVKVE